MRVRLGELVLELQSALSLPWFGRLPKTDLPPDLRVRALRTEDASEAILRRGHTPAFRHGSIRGFVTPAGFCVSDDFSVLHITPEAIVAEVHPGSLEDGYTFANTTVFVALTLALRLHGYYHHHAALLRSPRGVTVAVLGEGGAGKTTTTLSLLRAGYAYASDDALFLGADGQFRGMPLLFHVAPRTAAAFPEVLPHLGRAYRANNDKRELDPRLVYPGREIAGAHRADVVLSPMVDVTRATALVPISGADLLGRLVTASAFLVVDGMPRMEEQWKLETTVANRAKGYELRLGPDALERPELVAERLEP